MKFILLILTILFFQTVCADTLSLYSYSSLIDDESVALKGKYEREVCDLEFGTQRTQDSVKDPVEALYECVRKSRFGLASCERNYSELKEFCGNEIVRDFKTKYLGKCKIAKFRHYKVTQTIRALNITQKALKSEGRAVERSILETLQSYKSRQQILKLSVRLNCRRSRDRR